MGGGVAVDEATSTTGVPTNPFGSGSSDIIDVSTTRMEDDPHGDA